VPGKAKLPSRANSTALPIVSQFRNYSGERTIVDLLQAAAERIHSWLTPSLVINMIAHYLQEVPMKKTQCASLLLVFGLTLSLQVEAASYKSGTLTPIHNSTRRGAYMIETIGDTLHQAPTQNTRLIIRVSGADKKLIKPESIALVDKSGAAIKPVFREDRKVGHEENTGLPVTVGGYGDSSGAHVSGVGVDLNKILGPQGDYAYTKVDWPKETFTADKRLQIVMPGGQAIVLPLTSLAK
jgi:hypothetical protein